MQMATLNIKLEKYQGTHIFYHIRLHNVITHKPDLVWFLQYDNFGKYICEIIFLLILIVFNNQPIAGYRNFIYANSSEDGCLSTIIYCFRRYVI